VVPTLRDGLAAVDLTSGGGDGAQS
jgi:hypothetical protein